MYVRVISVVFGALKHTQIVFFLHIFLAQRRVASHESEAGPLSLHNVNGQGIDLYRA